jgi:CheY-like chemotaxis protein
VLRILVADDNANIQKMVSLAFQERGIEVIAVGNGEAAVRRLPDLNPDVILADIFMPLRSGYEVCEWVKKESRFSHIPVILLVGAFDPLDEKEARRVGADGVLKKPFIPPDPLIAMVTSALEKNAKSAAELAKTKEAPVPAPTPAAIALPELPLKIEPKPLPEFPDPSPEEVSLIYGFGTGRRTLDDEDADPTIVDAAEGADSGQELHEEFDGASTTSDWRRSAMEFEVPAETAGTPAFSSDQENESTLPSAPDVRHVPDEAGSEEITSAAAETAEPESSFEEPAAETQPSDIAENAPIEFATDESRLGTAPPEALQDSTASVEAARSDADSLESATPAVEADTSAPEAEPKPEPSVSSPTPHWMDLMASPAEPQSSNWFSSTLRAHSQERLSDAEGREELTGQEPPVIPARDEENSVANASAENEIPGQAKAFPSEEEPFFADEPEPSEPSARIDAASDEAAAATGDEFPIEPHGPEAFLQAQLRVPPEDDAPFEAEQYDEPRLDKEPQLVEPPAVRGKPDPLLVDEPPRGFLPYETRGHELAPTYDFLTPPAEHAEEPISKSEASEPEAGGESSLHAADESRDTSMEFSTAEFDERVPTVAPPNRQALAEIPSLNPPPGFREGSEEKGNASSVAKDSATVDAVVERLVEKLEPQIRELLSQNVLRPLVEGLLQKDFEKNHR